jgi:hypothetical protein
MKTTYLDNEIILLEGYKKDGTISHYQNRKLAEYKQIKQLLLHNVVGQSEQCCEPASEGFYLGTSCPKCKRPFRQNIK